MQNIRLTIARIDNFSCPSHKRQAFLFDSVVTGLGIRATSTGHKAFIFESKLNNQTIRITIGNTQIWSIDAASKEARRLKILCDTGIDPRREKVEKQAELKRVKELQQQIAITMGEAWSHYLEDNRHRWGWRHLKDHTDAVHLGGVKRKNRKALTVEGSLARLVPLKLTELTSERLRLWLKREASFRPTQAALSFRLLRAFLNWCAEQPEYRDIVQDAHTLKKVRAILPKPRAKDGCLQREQLHLWFKAVKTINPVISVYCQVLLLTGGRRDEFLKLKWIDVDFRWKSIRLADKVEDVRFIPLTPYVEYLLNSLPRINEWVFGSERSTTGHLISPYKAFTEALIKAGLPHLTLHDLRRSFGTLAEWVECPVGISAQIMGHKPSALAEKHYRRRPLDLLRMWHEKIECWMLEQAGISFNANEQKGFLYIVS